MSAVLRAIANVMKEVGSVEKRGKNQFHNYDYATAADISHALQPLLAREGLVILQTEVERQFTMDGMLLEITYEFTLAHTCGEVYPQKILQTGMSSARNTKGGMDDKAVNKCHTAARKYFTLALFQIPTGAYDDADNDEDKPAPKAGAPNAQPSKQPMQTGAARKAAPKPPNDDEAALKSIGESLSRMIAECTAVEQIDEVLNRPDMDELRERKPAWAEVVGSRARQKRAELSGDLIAAD